MSDDSYHNVPENSAFFQGHMGQFFAHGKYSFQIMRNESDVNAIEDINAAKYRKVFVDLINNRINARNLGGGRLLPVHADDLVISAIKLVDNVQSGYEGGYFKLFPRGAVCKKDGCNHYFDIDKGRNCGHKDSDPFEQITFLAFCDTCGRLLDLKYMTNILKDCPNPKCKEKNGLAILTATKKDDLNSYRLMCKKCKKEVRLRFLDCDHIVRKTDEVLSTQPKKRFRGVPARAGTILHPEVKTIPDIPQSYELDETGKRTMHARNLSEAFRDFFGGDLDESLLYLPEFRQAMMDDSKFWELSKVKDICEDARDFSKDVSFDLLNRRNWAPEQFLYVIRIILIQAKMMISQNMDKARVEDRYGIEHINQGLDQVKDIQFNVEDVEGYILMSFANNGVIGKQVPRKKNMPSSGFLDPNLYERFGLKSVSHFSNLNMIQALLGVIEGSTRSTPVLFRPIMTGKEGNAKPTVFVRSFLTEGILFHLDYERVLQWVTVNKDIIRPDEKYLNSSGLPDVRYRNLILHDEPSRIAVEKLLHTYSHMLIQQSTIDTGLDIQSLAEIIYPLTASVFIYSTNSINIGGLEFTYDYHLEDWLGRIYDLASDCPQDPACMLDEGGACNACSFIPEFVCERFNEDLDRSTLVGGTPRFNKGYFK